MGGGRSSLPFWVRLCGGPDNKSLIPSKCTLAFTQHTLRWFPLEIAHQGQIVPSQDGWAALQPPVCGAMGLQLVTSPRDLWVYKACAAQETKSPRHSSSLPLNSASHKRTKAATLTWKFNLLPTCDTIPRLILDSAGSLPSPRESCFTSWLAGLSSYMESRKQGAERSNLAAELGMAHPAWNPTCSSLPLGHFWIGFPGTCLSVSPACPLCQLDCFEHQALLSVQVCSWDNQWLMHVSGRAFRVIWFAWYLEWSSLFLFSFFSLSL
jgi:hypothetical protein